MSLRVVKGNARCKSESEFCQFARFRSSYICQCTSTKRQRRDHFGFRVKLSSVTTSLTTQR